MSPESLNAYHAENPPPEQEIADLRTRLQTAEQQLGRVREEVKGLREALDGGLERELFAEIERLTVRIKEQVLTGARNEAESLLGQLEQFHADLKEKYKERQTALSATPSDGCGKGRTETSPAKTLLLRMIDLLDGEHEEEYFAVLFQFLDLHSEIISEVSSKGKEGDS